MERICWLNPHTAAADDDSHNKLYNPGRGLSAARHSFAAADAQRPPAALDDKQGNVTPCNYRSPLFCSGVAVPFSDQAKRPVVRGVVALEDIDQSNDRLPISRSFGADWLGGQVGERGRWGWGGRGGVGPQLPINRIWQRVLHQQRLTQDGDPARSSDH